MSSINNISKIIITLVIYILYYQANDSLAQEQNPKLPPSMIYHKLIYHDKLDKILVFGGQSKHGWKADIKDVWTFDTNNYDWINLCKNEAVSDSGYAAHSPVYHKKSNHIIFLNQIGETWAFQVESNKWTNMKPDNSPPTRCGHNMVYDSSSDKVILFGGFSCVKPNNPDFKVFNDTWVYDYNSNTWSEMNPENSPPNRMFASMIYNSAEDKIVLWGGRLWEPLADNSIWEYDYYRNNWAEIENIDGPKTSYAYPAMVYIEEKNDLILFGGGILESAFVGKQVNEMWKFDFVDEKWLLLNTTNTPPPVTIHSMVYVPKIEEIILCGGEIRSMYSNNILEGTWILSIKDLVWDKK